MPVALRTRPLPYDANVAIRHIGRRDPIMRGIVRACGPFDLRRRGTPFQSLMRALLYQQLAGAAAAAIERRFLALYGGRAPSARELLLTKPEELRSVGLSRQKSSYLHGLAEHVESGAITDRRLARMPDDEVIAAVTEIKGIGPWTAHMLLMFSLGRPDVLPVGDYGVRKAMMLSYELPELPDPKTMERIGEPWRPYRSAASWYLWRRIDTLKL